MGFRKVTMWVVFGLVFAWSPFVFADDVMPPVWRGEDRTVFAEWNFANVDWTPDSWSSNPGGLDTPVYRLRDVPPSVFHESYASRENVWQINADYGLGFWIPNFSGGEYKTIQVQITYLADDEAGNVFPGVNIPLENPWWFGELSDSVAHTDSWITDVYLVEIQPNPASEYVYLFAEDSLGDPYYPAYIDQVVIDTICVPEPATLGLLLIGGLALLRGRR